jgi:hypothetical protein
MDVQCRQSVALDAANGRVPREGSRHVLTRGCEDSEKEEESRGGKQTDYHMKAQLCMTD